MDSSVVLDKQKLEDSKQAVALLFVLLWFNALIKLVKKEKDGI